MAKNKNSRVFINLECAPCRTNKNKKSTGISRYFTSKNKKNNLKKIELLKHCKFCNQHTLHKEIK